MVIGNACACSPSGTPRPHDGDALPSGRSPFESLRVSGSSLRGNPQICRTPPRATAKSFTEVSAYPSIHGPKDGPLLGMNGFQEMRTVRAE